MEIWKSLIKLLVVILLILVGAKVIYKDNFAIITGSIECDAATDEDRYKLTNKDINFPTGFTSENCVVVSVGANNMTNKGYSYTQGFKSELTALDMSWATEGIKVMLGYNNTEIIKISAVNITKQTATKKYKIVLMKIN